MNVYGLEGNEIFPVYLTKQRSVQITKIHLLILSDDQKSHYCLIKNLDRLLKTLLRSERTARSKYNVRKFCDRCLQSIDKGKLMQHRRLCFDQEPLLIQMPNKLETLKFESFNCQIRCPFVLYADLEAFDVKKHSFTDMLEDYSRSTLNNMGAATLHIEDQLPCSFGAVLIDVRSGKAEKQIFYRGDQVIGEMMKTIKEWLKGAYQEQQKFRKLAMNLADKANFLASWTAPCCICNEEFDGCEEESKVVHHSHLTGDIHGVAHRKCNLDCSVMKFLPVFFHNFSRYDSHHIIKDLEIYDGEELNAIAKTDETFISFSVRVPVGSYVDKRGLTKCIKSDIRFLDSLNFMASGLDALAQTLSDEDLSLLKQNFSPDSEEMLKKIRRKGFFPYGYLDSSEKFNAPFPDYGPDWVNTLSGKIDLTLEQYQEAREMYHLIGCKNFGDYHDVYLKIDVLACKCF